MSTEHGVPRRGFGAQVLRRVTAVASRAAQSFGSGLIAQTCSAATNFGLTVLAGHILGASGLGTVLIGFAAYILLLGFSRSLLTEPLVTSSSGRGLSERILSARSALVLVLTATVAAAGLLAALSVVLPAQMGRGMLLFA